MLRLSRRAAIVMTILVGAFIALLVPSPASAAGGVEIAFTPAEITVVRGDQVQVALSIKNGTDVALSDIKLLDVDGGAIDFSYDSGQPTAVPANGSAVATAHVSLAAPLPQATSIVAVVTFIAGSTQQSAAATLKVTSGAWPTAAPGPISITAKGPETLVDNRAVDVIFTVTNASSATQQISSAQLTYPSYLEVTVVGEDVEGKDGTLDLPAVPDLEGGGGASIHLQVRAPQGVRPGAVLIVFDVTYTEPSSTITGFSTGSHGLSLSVFGEGDAAAVFTSALAPAFWLVPGLLMVLTLWFFWMKISPRRAPFDMTTVARQRDAEPQSRLGSGSSPQGTAHYRTVSHGSPERARAG